MKKTTAAAGLMAAAVLLTGCSSGSNDNAPARHSPSRPAAQGNGPYPTPTSGAKTSPYPTGAAGTPKGGLPQLRQTDQKDADAVARGAVTAMFTSDTDLDTSPYDATARAAAGGWLTSTYARQITGHRPQGAPGADWLTWDKHHAYTTVSITNAGEDGMPSDAPLRAYREFAVTVTPHGRDGWKGHPEDHTAFVKLERTNSAGAWHVAATTMQ